MIVTSVEVPTSYRILNASPERPFVSASMKLDRALLAEIMGEISGKKEFPPSEDSNAFLRCQDAGSNFRLLFKTSSSRRTS